MRVGRWASIAVAGAVGAFGCGDDGASESTAAATRGTQGSSTVRAVTSLAVDDWKPPALVVVSQSGRLEVGAFYYGTSNMVADGTTPPSGPPVAEGAAVRFIYPERGWTFRAVARRRHAGRPMKLEITAIDEHRFRIAAPRPASYEILVDAKSPEGQHRGAGYVFMWVVLPS